MSWLRKICKGSCHKISKGHHQKKSDNDDGVCNEPTNSQLLSEEDLKKPISTGTKSNANEDEQLAWALHESLNTKSPPSESKESPRICAGCENEIGLEEFVSVTGALWHRECFSCYACCQPIIGYDFSIYQDHPYHMPCYQNLYHPKCYVCKEFVPTKMNGEPDCQTLSFWLQKSCPSHQHDGTQYCFACHRWEPRGANFSRLDDRSKICEDCLNSSITDTDMCQPLYRDVQIFYKDLNMDVDQNIQLLLVDRGVLLSAAEKKEDYPFRDNIEGLCQLNTPTDQIKYKWPKFTIFLLKGLPRILTGLNLAHELMHAWLHLNGYDNLAPLVEEGICVVMSYMWLDLEMTSGSESSNVPSSSSSSSAPYRKGPKSQFEWKFAKYYKGNMENQRSPIYGDGFRLGYAAVTNYGFKNVLDHLKLTGNFPSK